MPKQDAYQVKITLDSIPSIWRRMNVLGSDTFLAFHAAIQDTMGWKDNHLHEFRVMNPLSGKAEFIGIPDDEFKWDPIIISGEKRLVSEIFRKNNLTAKYIYDFGDYWAHSLKVERIFSVDNDHVFPQCLSGEKACPPEDCGGVTGYKKLLDLYNCGQYDDTDEESFNYFVKLLQPERFEAKEVEYRKFGRSSAYSVTDHKLWLRKLLQGKLSLGELKQDFSAKMPQNEIETLRKTILGRPLRYRNRAICILALLRGISQETIEDHLFISKSTIICNFNGYKNYGVEKIVKDKRKGIKKHANLKYINKVFTIIHSPPSLYGFNRTTWKQRDIIKVMSDEGLKISIHGLCKIIKTAGYKYRKAKTVLTSNDPNYRKKLIK